VSLTDHQVVVLITGISASGKSTVAELLATRFDRAAHVRGDNFRRMIVSGRALMTTELSPQARRQLELRYQLGAATADAYFGEGLSVIVQDVVLGADLQMYTHLIESRPLCVVVLIPRLDVVGIRERDREKSAYGSGRADPAALDAALRDLTPRLGLWLDSSDQTPEQTVEEIIDRAWLEARVP
jgi:cytidylate kinase